MAVDPSTAKLIAQIAIRAATDEETRKKIIMIALVPLIVVLLILTLFVYILTSPLSFLASFLTNGNEIALIESFKTNHDSKVKLQTAITVLNGKYPMPAEGEIASPYGMRLHPVIKEYRMHTGIDIGTTWHCAVSSIAKGQVAKVGIDKGYGNYVIIRHDLTEETFYSVYAHLSRVYVLPDQEVEQGSIIGLEGGEPGKDPNPGYSTGHHLHFEIRTSMDPSSHVDPVPYLYDTDKGKEKTENEKEAAD